ncbi:hypothetical protein [Trinickia mobilis]|uniref:hypothetical protein n=1 Tax=Trinickia mobilis TaxID=2816356 RepID=UPI001A8C1517|nr:hypothetical protein [Trinickia mobilis]
MLFLENPERRPSLWDSLTTQLTEQAMCIVIWDGLGNPLAQARILDSESAANAIAKLRASQVCRIGANRDQAISPHFAGRREDDTVTITELLTYPSEGSVTLGENKMKADLEAAVINLFFAEDGVKTVCVPIHLAPWTMDDAEIDLTQEGLVFKKKP